MAEIGSFIGPYEILAQIGAGGMGVVYDAQLPAGTHVALKVLSPQRSGDHRSHRRFLDEGVAGSIVAHPNVASTLSHGTTEDGVPFLVMERVRGEPLGARIHREGAPSLQRGVEIVQQILAGLGAMHAAGIVHGDVKSDNVLVARRDDGSDVATLIDFGLAHVQFATRDLRRRHADEEVISGTPDYMAPEVIRGEGSSTGSDLYSVGVILYELITGGTPFGDGTPDEIMNCHLDDQVVPPSLRRTTIPPILERIAIRALEKDPAQRFETAAAFASALAVAQPLLDDDITGAPGDHFSCNSPTLEWTALESSPSTREPQARGTPGYNSRR